MRGPSVSAIKAACPQCAAEITFSQAYQQHGGPQHRNAVLCMTCRAFLVIEGTTVRNPTDAEFDSAMCNPVIQQGIAVLAAMHANGTVR